MNNEGMKPGDGGEEGISHAYETLGYIIAQHRQVSQEMEARRPEIEARLSQLDQQRDDAETRGDAQEQRQINTEIGDLQQALKVLDESKANPL